MNERQDRQTCLIVGGIAAAYLLMVFLGCRLWSLDFTNCAHAFEPLQPALFIPAGLSFTAVSLVMFHKSKEPRKTTITYTGIVATIAIMMSFTMSQIASVTQNTAMFCLILIVVWISLSSTKSLRNAFLGWVIVAVFLAIMITNPDHQMLTSLLYAMFSGGITLYTTSASRLAEWSGLTIVLAIFALVGVRAYEAVVEWGMPPPGYEWLLVFEGISRAGIHADDIMIITSGFFGLVPFVYLFTKNE